MVRRIINIDLTRCSGCGQCAQRCRQGALVVKDGAACLLADRFCDGLGVCIEDCPTKALFLEEREAAPFLGQYVGRDAGSRAGTPPAATDRPDAPGPPAVLPGDDDKLFRHRLGLCCRATECGRLCANLIKQPGRAGVWCVDVAAGRKIDLYKALTDRDFRCPTGVF